jgi:hypothetical protein
VFRRADRREWAVLGLVALAWCLLVAPALHRLTHTHGHAHTHATSGNFEHQNLSFTAPPAPLVMVAVVTRLEQVRDARPVAPSVEPLRRVEQSQAP